MSFCKKNKWNVPPKNLLLFRDRAERAARLMFFGVVREGASEPAVGQVRKYVKRAEAGENEVG